MSEELRLQELLRALDGREIISLHWGGVVLVKDGQLIQEGVVIEPMPSLAEARILLQEAVANEIGTDEELTAAVEEEFGSEDSG